MLTDKAMILVVDDEPINIEVLYELLHNEYEIRFATSGVKGLEIARAQSPDLILLDVMMPSMSGYDVCRILKEDPDLKTVPVVFITAMNEQADEMQGLKLGAIDYLTKPISPDITKARVRNFVNLKKQQDLLANMAFVDGLTGIPNRRRLDDSLTLEWRRALRSHQSLGLMMIDIDHFKLYNDNYGHDAGDACLKAVATAMHEQVVRAGDLMARYGGEEFVGLMPNTDIKGAVAFAENMARSVAALEIPHAHSLVSDQITLSIGVNAIVPTDNDDIQSFMKTADNALYKAKENGRNRVCTP